MLRLSRAQVRRVDSVCINDFGLPGIVLMENAARGVVKAAREHLTGPALVVCGGGNNGGDGYAIARLLDNAGHGVAVLAVTPRDKLAGDARVMADVVHAMKLDVTTLAATGDDGDHELDQQLAAAFDGRVVIFDCLYGTGLNKPPTGTAARVIGAISRARGAGAFVIAVDVPSGLDCDTGTPPGARVTADLTVTFVAEKVGFARPQAAAYLGRVVVGDIGCPREAVERAVREQP